MEKTSILEGLFYTFIYGLVLNLSICISNLTNEMKILGYLTLVPMFILFYYLPLLPSFIPKNNIVDRSIQRLGIWLYIHFYIPMLLKLEKKILKTRTGAERKLGLKKNEYAELISS